MKGLTRLSINVPDTRWSLAGFATLNTILLTTSVLVAGLFGATARAMASSPYVSGIKLPGNRIEDQTFFGEIKSAIGGRAELPCNLTLPSPDDAIQLIFWYRGNTSRAPIYTVDSRTSSLFNATHFPSSDIFSPKRATFELNSQPLATLQIEPVQEDDHGSYRCRVDFRYGRTINSFVSLHIIVPPKRIAIRDQNGNFVHNTTIGPFNQNSDVILICESDGGIPPPVLLWYKNGVMIDGSYVVGKNGSVWNELTIYKLSPRDLLDRYVCQTGNFNSSSPIEAHVTIDVNLLPVDVRILSPRNPLIAGRKVDVRCESHGSKPAATIRWFKNNVSLAHSSEIYESNKTESSITLMPSMLDNNVHLQCRAYNPKLPDKYIEDAWTLEVLYKPHVVLSIANSNKTSIVEEGSQVLIECQVAANPALVDLQILHDFKPIHRLEHLDVRRENITRVLLDAVNATHRGRYQCVASNANFGLSRSNDVQLDVLFVPYCALKQTNSNQTSVVQQHALALNETVRLKCDVASNPSSNHFYWTLNEDTPQHHLLAESDSSNELTFSVASLDTFGKVRCWAKNRIGMQKEPCLFVVTKAGPPSPLDGCSVTNKTTTSLNVECIPGESGGSTQLFHAHVFELDGEESPLESGDLDPNDGLQSHLPSTAKMNLTSEKSPTFYLSNLRPGTSYTIELYASNARGQSDRARLRVTTKFTKNTKLISSSLQEIEYDPLFSGVIGALLIALCLVTVAFVFCRLRQRQISRRTKQQKEEQIKQNFAFRSSAHQDKDDARPSLLPNGAAGNNKPDIISFENMSTPKRDLYVIKEPLSMSEVQDSPVQLANSLMMGPTEASLMPLGSGPSHVSALYPQPFLTPSSMVAQSTELMPSRALLSSSCLQPTNSSHPSQQFFISPPAEAILYASASTLHPQIVSFNDKIDGIVLNGAHFGYYHAENVPSAETIVLHHQSNQVPQPQQEKIRDFNVHQSTV